MAGLPKGRHLGFIYLNHLRKDHHENEKSPCYIAILDLCRRHRLWINKNCVSVHFGALSGRRSAGVGRSELEEDETINTRKLVA